MKRIICIFLSLIVVLGALTLTANADAPAYRDYDTDPVSQAEWLQFLAAIEFQFLDEAVKTWAIQDFAVSGEGQIALALTAANHSSGGVVVQVYDPSGVFQYGYKIINDGSACTVFFEGELLTIYWFRAGMFGSFDSEGNSVKFRRMRDTTANYMAIDQEQHLPASGKVGDLKYSAERKYLAEKWKVWPNNYIRFCVENSDGSQTVIYEAPDEYYHRIVALAAFVLIIPLMFIASSVKHRIEKAKQEAEDE